MFLPSVYFLIFPVPGLTHGTPRRLSLLSFFLYVLFYFPLPLTFCSYSSVTVFKRHISSVCWHLGVLINICNMWFSKSGAEMQLGAATIHLAPPGEFAGLWFTNTCKEICCKYLVRMAVRKRRFLRFNLRRKIWDSGFQIRLDKRSGMSKGKRCQVCT